MSLYDNSLYMQDVETVAKAVNWNKLNGKNLAISGATGMIGSFLIDVLLYSAEQTGNRVDIYAFGRSEEKAKSRFEKYADQDMFHFVKQDINEVISMDAFAGIEKMDYVIHGASNTHPRAYSSDPIGTITANVLGTYNLLNFADALGCERFCFLSSVEIYGENRGDTDKFAEDYLGYIDCNTLRAGYPESKRTGETMCQAFAKQKNMDVVIPRLSRVYGPTMLMTDSKALSQFILKGVNKEDIVLKSEGTQEFSYSYVGDAVSGILKILFDGESLEAYNIVSKESDIKLRDLAKIIADEAGKQVVFELPDAVEAAGYSKATKATLAVDKLNGIGWKSMFDIKTGLAHTISILREIQ